MKILNDVIVKTIPIVPRGIVRKFANKYIAGDKLSDAIKTARELNAKGFMGTMDVLGEHINNKDEAIRLDSFINNPNACRLYLKNGYEKRGIVNFRKGQFWCMEKKLEKRVKNIY